MLPIPNPIAFTIFGYQIRWYALTMISGLLLGIGVAYLRRKRFGVSEEDIVDYILVVVPSAIIGARLYYVLFEWEQYKDNLLEIFYIHHGGLAIHGALLVGLVVTYFYCRYKNFNLLKFLDFVAPSMILGQAIGRWGNYFNMEAHGRVTDVPWAIPILERGKLVYVHPTFLYESLWDLCVFFLLLFYEDRFETKWGEGAALYLMLYSLGRFFIEGLRTDSLMFLGLRQAQIISIVLFLCGLVLFVGVKKYGKPVKSR